MNHVNILVSGFLTQYWGFWRFVRFLQGRNNLQNFTWPTEVFYSIFEGFGRDHNFFAKAVETYVDLFV